MEMKKLITYVISIIIQIGVSSPRLKERVARIRRLTRGRSVR